MASHEEVRPSTMRKYMKRQRLQKTYAFAACIKIQTEDEGIRLGGSNTRLLLKRGLFGSRWITYVAKCWDEPSDAYAELYIYGHSELLRPLQRKYVPGIIGVSDNPNGGLFCAILPPHNVGWRHVHRNISANVMVKVIAAYEAIHKQGVLHGNAALRHMLIGDDDKVTIIDFSSARTIEDHTSVGPERCTEADLRREMRKVKYLLDYDGAKKTERNLANTHASGAPGTGLTEKFDTFDLSELDAWDQACASDNGLRFEVPSDWRSDARQHPPLDEPISRVDEGQVSEATSRVSDVASCSQGTGGLFATALPALSVPLVRSPKPRRLFTSDESQQESIPTINVEETGGGSDNTGPASKGDLYPEPVLPREKRTHEVAFHPDTDDNSLWATGRSLKRVKRPPTPYIPSLQLPEDRDAEDANDMTGRAHLSPSFTEDVNPREPPPYRQSSHSPSLPETNRTSHNGEEDNDLFIIITSPTGQRRVWGVSETVATQISTILDHRPDDHCDISQQATGEEGVAPLALKRKAEESLGVDERPKMMKKAHTLFSRLFG